MNATRRDDRLGGTTWWRLSAIVLLVGLAQVASAGEFERLTPGVSTAEDAKRELGEPTRQGTILTFSSEKLAAKIAVEIEKGTNIILSIAVTPKTPSSRADMVRWLSLGEPAFKESVGGEDVELFLSQLIQLHVKDGRVTELTHVAPKLVSAKRRAEAEAKRRNGDRAGAIADLTNLRKIVPEDETICFALAEALHEAGRDPQALNVLVEGLALAPDNEPALLLRVYIEAGLWSRDPGWLGARVGNCFVISVFPDTPAAKAGLREWDAIDEVDGKPIKDAWKLRERLGELRVGQDVVLKLSRGRASFEARMTAIDRSDYFAGKPEPTDNLEAGIALAVTGDMVKAEKRLRKAVAENPTPRARYELAQAAECLDYERGIQEWRTFQEHSGRDVPLVWRHHASEELKALEGELEYYRRLKGTLETKDWDSIQYASPADTPVACAQDQLAKGQYRAHLKLYSKAASAYLAASRLWLDLSGSWYNLAECLEHYDLAKARAAYARYARATEGAENVKNFRQKALDRKARLETALARKLQGDRKAAKKQWAEALADYEAASAAAPNSTELLRCRIQTLAAMGRADDAWDLSQQVSEHGHSPATAVIHAYMGSVHYKAGRFRPATDEYLVAWTDAPNVPRYLYYHAIAAEKCQSKAGFMGAWYLYLKESEGYPEEAERRRTAEERVEKLK